MPLQGSLENLGLADLLQTGLAGREGGYLTLRRHAQHAMLYVGENGLHLIEPDPLDPQDVLSVRDFEIFVTAQFKATRQSGGEVLMQKEITGKTSSRAASDLTEAERRVLPLVMQDMAQQAIDQLSNPDW